MKNVIFSMLAFIVMVAASCQSESKDNKTDVDTVGLGLDSGERSMDTVTIDSTKITSSQERYPNQ